MRDYKYIVLIHGGIGPNVWDRELEISAVDFMDAAQQAQNYADDMDGSVIELEQMDWWYIKKKTVKT